MTAIRNASIVRATIRRRIEALERAAQTIRQAYEDDELLLLESGPVIRLGDAIRVPEEDEEDEEETWPLWHIVQMLDACRRELEESLASHEYRPWWAD
jgi:hypothetical protein